MLMNNKEYLSVFEEIKIKICSARRNAILTWKLCRRSLHNYHGRSTLPGIYPHKRLFLLILSPGV